jgi:eukaryotic-like serine/threonine-protein kinase
VTASAEERRDRAEALYERARELPTAERAAFLGRECGTDVDLRDELHELLTHADDAEAFFTRLSRLVTNTAAGDAVVAGRYQVGPCIGVGGMGAVYRAHDVRLQRDVALKFLPPHITAALDAQERLLHEARAAAALEHTNVCTIHEIGETEDGRSFISMALYDGETLKQRLQHGALPVAEAVDIARQLGRGLAAAHARGLVHRDVKPGNVMLVRDGAVKLLDFGLARLSEASDTQPGVTQGTVAYMSPEQARGEAVDARSDLFSLGVVLYEMLTGMHPFRGGSHSAVMQAVLHQPVEPLRRHVTDAAPGLERIVGRLLDKRPAARYGSAAELVAELDHLTFTSPPRRSRWLAGAAGLAVMAAVWLGVSVWRGGGGGASADVTRAAAAPASTTKTIAVLPFTNVGRDPAHDYLVDGLTEELIGALSKVRALRVVARTSAFAFRGQSRDIREIGRALDVAAILEGSVQTAGDRIRVRAQLINVSDGLHLWSEMYDRDVADIFTVQRDLALLIAAALEAGLTQAERERVAQRPTASAEAYALYLKGRHFWNQRTPDSFLKAAEYFERAIEVDPQFAAAHAGLAGVISMQGIWGVLAADVAEERMRVSAQRAVQLDDRLADGHAVLGAYLHVYEWDVAAAERAQLRALELDPNLVTAHYFYGNLLRATGRIDEAIEQYRTAIALDPLDPTLSERLGRTLVLAGRAEEAREHFLGALELDSLFWWPHIGLGVYHEAGGRWDEALAAYERARLLGGLTLIDIGRVLALAGREREARRVLAEVERAASSTGMHDPGVATVLLALGDADAAIAWLEQSVRERHPRVRFIAGDPAYTAFEVEPRYTDLLRRIGLRH